ncbi:MAG: cytoplasmic protein [Comamonadaceae bacterium]|nr:MAG: cytoplasmic protein [Comamonadaceae bacterium]
MTGTYIGHLAQNDPVLSFLQHELQQKIEGATDSSSYRVFKLNGSNDVYLYQDRCTGKKLIGKFFLTSRKSDVTKADLHLTREFDSLCMMRDTGLTGSPHNVVKPLGFNHALNALLVTECFEGKLLSAVILDAIHSGDPRELYAKLTALAYFLSQFHNRTATGVGVDFQQDCNYLDTLIARLLAIQAISGHEVAEWHGLRDQWRSLPKMWQDQQVYVHGDATPENFMFGSGLDVMAFDLERSKRADRVFDTGRIAGELKHFFMWASGNKHAAEPFIGHFLWEYACHFPDRDSAFASITSRTPFYMGITLLRIARNSWVDHNHRHQLIREAKACLRSC